MTASRLRGTTAQPKGAALSVAARRGSDLRVVRIDAVLELTEHSVVTRKSDGRLRSAHAEDIGQLLRLWERVYDGTETTTSATWEGHARGWFARYVEDNAHARFPVIEVEGGLVATAIGTLELGVPNPHCLRGRTTRLMNVVTLPTHRSQGYATMLVLDIIDWARSIDADRIDLSTTPEGRRIYQRIGFTQTAAPRMKLVF